MPKLKKKVFNESANPEKPSLELRLSWFSEEEAYNILITYLFDLEYSTVGDPNKKKGIVYKPGFYMEPFKPDLELELTKETDKMYITIRGLDGNRRILMNPKFMKRLLGNELSNNSFEKASIPRTDIEKCINNLIPRLKGIIFYFLYPHSTLESKKIPVYVANEIYKHKQQTRTNKLKDAVNKIVNEIVMFQEGLS